MISSVQKKGHFPLKCEKVILKKFATFQTADDVADFLGRCQNPEGGFGGGPGQLSHLAPTYGAVNALCCLGTERAYQVINREKLTSWMNSLRLEDGSFVMHRDGEV